MNFLTFGEFWGGQLGGGLRYSKELANLAKLYTDESKYSSKNNNFDFKLTIFTDRY